MGRLRSGGRRRFKQCHVILMSYGGCGTQQVSVSIRNRKSSLTDSDRATMLQVKSVLGPIVN